MKPKVVVVIVVWNGVADTLECLQSLKGDEYPNKEIVIIDNGSTDGSSEKILSEGFRVRILRAKKNLGFTGGNNLGLSEAFRQGAKYAFLLNNDTVLEADAIGNLVEAAEKHTNAGILAPVMHYYDNPSEIWFAGARLDLSRGEALHDVCLKPERTDGLYESPWVSGCAMLVRMTAVEQVGGFDDRFYLTWEDVDWCVRMTLAEWMVAVVPNALIYHKGGRSGAKLSDVKSYYAVRNSLLLARKHAGLGYVFAVWTVLVKHLRSALRLVGEERDLVLKTVWEGLFDHWLSKYGPRRPKGRGVAERKVVGGVNTETVIEGRH